MRLTESLDALSSISVHQAVVKRSLPEVAYLFVAAAIFTFWINSAYWLHTYQLLNIHGVMDVVFLLSQTLLVWGVTTMVLLLFCWGKLTKPLLSVLFVISAACAYFSFKYQVYIDRHMLTNVMRTDVHEATGLLSWKFLLWMLVYVTPALAYVWGV